ncbi:MAG: nucleotidyl transferase AbiEii/AbiGii toxin family protein [Olegusella sp.]|nr:nucleotidyl transferase AbiEii/AbiGii toxin family protein [Olegusella sp.]
MRTNNAMQLKAKVNNRAKAVGISPAHAMQAYVLDCLVVRLSRSRYCDSVIVKGGVLIGSLIGVDKRTTMDLDTTVRGLELSHESARAMFDEVCALESDDDFSFTLVRTEDIRETDDYPGIRVHLRADFPPLSMPVSVDVTTGDRIVPSAVTHTFKLTFDDDFVDVLSYPTATVLAEKLETVLSRGVTNTRPRDFYDIHMLWRLRRDDFTLEELADALKATAEKRRSVSLIATWRETIAAIESDKSMLRQWEAYARRFSYVGVLSLGETCQTIAEIMADYDRVVAEQTLFSELRHGRVSGESEGWMPTPDARVQLSDTPSGDS